MNNCKQCNGAGYTIALNSNHDTYEKVDCIDCLLEERYKAQLFKQFSSFLRTASVERLASALSALIIDVSTEDQQERLVEYVNGKQKPEFFATISILGDELK